MEVEVLDLDLTSNELEGLIEIIESFKSSFRSVERLNIEVYKSSTGKISFKVNGKNLIPVDFP